MNIIKFIENLRKDQTYSEIGNQIDRIRRRHADTESIGIKACILVICLGLLGLVMMTLFDLAMINIQPDGVLKGLLTFGYFLSMLMSLLIVYGMFELIKKFMKRK